MTYRVRSRADAEGAVRLLRFAYLCLLMALENRTARTQEPGVTVDADVEFGRLGVSFDLARLAVRTYRRPVPARA